MEVLRTGGCGRIAGLKAKKEQAIIIAEDADQKEALPVENKDEWKRGISGGIDLFFFAR